MSGVLLLHGFTGSPESWRSVREHLPDTLSVSTPYVLGHGQTPSPGSSFDGEARRLVALAQAELGKAPLHVVGYSLGARLALGIALLFGEQIRSLTLIGVNPGLSSGEERAARARADAEWMRLLDTQGVDAFARAWQNQALFDSQARLDPALLAEQGRIRRTHTPTGLSAALRVLGLSEMRNFREDLGKIAIPTSLMVGALDLKFQRLAREIQDLLPKAALVVVPGAGHNLLLEAPKAVAEEICRIRSMHPPSQSDYASEERAERSP